MNTNIACSILLLMIISGNALAECKNKQPLAIAFANPSGFSCPGGYYSSGGACVPSGPSLRYAFFNNGGSCPGGYYLSGKSCVASSAHSCYAFFNNNGSCPGGYYTSGNSCVSN